jgi:hypothetical protein
VITILSRPNANLRRGANLAGLDKGIIKPKAWFCLDLLVVFLWGLPITPFEIASFAA